MVRRGPEMLRAGVGILFYWGPLTRVQSKVYRPEPRHRTHASSRVLLSRNHDTSMALTGRYIAGDSGRILCQKKEKKSIHFP